MSNPNYAIFQNVSLDPLAKVTYYSSRNVPKTKVPVLFVCCLTRFSVIMLMDGETTEDISKAIITFQLRFCVRTENFYADKGSILLKSNLVSPHPMPGDLDTDVNIFNNKPWSHFRQFSESLTSVMKRIAKKFAEAKIPKLEDIMLKYEVLTSVRIIHLTS